MTKLLLSELLTEEQCKDRVTEADLLSVAHFSSEARRRERLSWRALLYDFLGERVEIEYEDGAPIVVGQDIHIGVSHTKDMVAVVVSDNPCAVDIERCDRDVKRISDRFFTEEEQSLATDNLAQLVVWCARECYYKLKRDKKIDILNDIRVTALDLESCRVTVTDCRGGSSEMKTKQTAEHIVVYVG